MPKFKLDTSDGLSQEWNYAFKVRLGPFLLLLSGFIFMGWCGHSYFVKKTFTPTQKHISSIVSEFNVRRHFDGRIYGTYWDDCGVTITADHVPGDMFEDSEDWVGKPVHRSMGIIDAAHYGDWSCKTSPREPVVGEKVSVIGYPGGSMHPSLRRGEIYIKRSVSGSPGYEKPTWIIIFYGEEPVVGGMSGGIVISEDGTPLGPLVTQNSPTFFQQFGGEKHSADFVALHDYWEFVLEPSND